MPLNITTGGMSARGFGFTTQGFYNLSLIISSNTTSYNIRTAALAAGWSGNNPLNLKLTINAGVTVSGTGTGSAAAIVLTSLVPKSIIKIYNNGTIVGVGGATGYNTTNGGSTGYPGNPTVVNPITFPNGYNGTGYPTGPGAGGSNPGYNYFSGGTSPNAGGGTDGGPAIYLASNVYLIINNSATGLITGGGGGASGMAGNNAGAPAGSNGGYCIEESGTHPAVVANNVSGGIIASGGGASGGWGNRYEGDGIGGRPGYPGTNYQYGASGISPGLATNNTGTTLINTTGTFTMSPSSTSALFFLSSTTWVCPAGVQVIQVTVAGAGGGQGGNYFDTGQTLRIGSAGSPGQIVTGQLTVTPGQTYTITVGTGGGFGRDSFYSAAGGAGGTGYVSGGTGVASSLGSGGGAGGSSAFLLGGTVLAAAVGGAGGNAASGGGSGGSVGGSNVIPVGGSTSTGTNGAAASSISSVYSGSYGNGQGSGPLTTIYNDISTTYPYLVSSLSTVSGGGNDWGLPMTLAPGTILWASGGSGTFVDSAYSTPYTALNSGAFSMGRTVSGINFATGATQGNGGSSYNFYYGCTYNNGGNGYVSISTVAPIYIPASGSITQYMNLAYAYGNPAVLTWTVTGTTFNYNISSATTYCGSTYSSSGSAPITQTVAGGYLVQTVTFTNNHPKDCCNGNQNYIYETYTLTMNYPNTAVLTAISSNGSQTGC